MFPSICTLVAAPNETHQDEEDLVEVEQKEEPEVEECEWEEEEAEDQEGAGEFSCYY